MINWVKLFVWTLNLNERGSLVKEFAIMGIGLWTKEHKKDKEYQGLGPCSECYDGETVCGCCGAESSCETCEGTGKESVVVMNKDYKKQKKDDIYRLFDAYGTDIKILTDTVVGLRPCQTKCFIEEYNRRKGK